MGFGFWISLEEGGGHEWNEGIRKGAARREKAVREQEKMEDETTHYPRTYIIGYPS